MERSIRFAKRPDGERIAYAVYGSGPPLLRGPGGNSHLELLSESALWRHGIELLASERSVICYDRHGNGLSDRNRTDFTWRDEVLDLLALMDELRLKEVPVIGVSGGGPAIIAFASTHPERVSRLILYGTLARPLQRYQVGATYEKLQELAAINPGLAIRVQTEMFYGSRFEQEILGVSERMRQAASPDIQAGLAQELLHTDISELAAKITAPTLILHRRGDQAVDFAAARDLTMMIRGARLVPLEGDSHMDQGEDFAQEVLAFLREDDKQSSNTTVSEDIANSGRVGLSARELDVLRLIAAGRSNQQIADELVISLNTVRRHVSNIFAKTGAANRADAVSYAHRNVLV